MLNSKFKCASINPNKIWIDKTGQKAIIADAESIYGKIEGESIIPIHENLKTQFSLERIENSEEFFIVFLIKQMCLL